MDGGTATRYRRLPGRGPRKGRFFKAFSSRCSLYLGDDHILAVENNGFSEDYKRFYFADIQAIVTRKTRNREVWSIVHGLMIAAFLTGALFSRNEAFRIFSWAFSGIFLLFFLINLLRGPTCMCHIRTAVQQDQLPSLSRLRVARKVIGTIRLAVEKVQGTLRAEEVSTHQSEENAHPASLAWDSRRPAREREPRHEVGTMHRIAFALMLLGGFLATIDLLHHTPAVTALSSMLASVCIVISLAKQHGSDIPRPVRSITWAALGFIFISYSLLYIFMMTTLLTHRPKGRYNEWNMYRAMLDLSPQDSQFFMGIYTLSAASSIILGTLGLVRMKRGRNAYASSPRPVQNPGGEPAS